MLKFYNSEMASIINSITNVIYKIISKMGGLPDEVIYDDTVSEKVSSYFRNNARRRYAKTEPKWICLVQTTSVKDISKYYHVYNIIN